jgi:hypothetical protein
VFLGDIVASTMRCGSASDLTILQCVKAWRPVNAKRPIGLSMKAHPIRSSDDAQFQSGQRQKTTRKH